MSFKDYLVEGDVVPFNRPKQRAFGKERDEADALLDEVQEDIHIVVQGAIDLLTQKGNDPEMSKRYVYSILSDIVMGHDIDKQ